jgi:hypothetical protein
MSSINYIFEDDAKDETPQIKQTEEGMQGFIISITYYYIASNPKSSIIRNDVYYGCFPDLYEMIFELLTKQDPYKDQVDKEKLDDRFLEITESPKEEIRNLVNESGHYKCSDVYIWKGLKPKKNEKRITSTFSYDPYGNVTFLEYMFTNPRQIVTDYSKMRGETDGELSYTLEDYCRYFSLNPQNIYFVDKDPELKKGILDKLGIKDLSKIGRALKQGIF